MYVLLITHELWLNSNLSNTFPAKNPSLTPHLHSLLVPIDFCCAWQWNYMWNPLVYAPIPSHHTSITGLALARHHFEPPPSTPSTSKKGQRGERGRWNTAYRTVHQVLTKKRCSSSTKSSRPITRGVATSRPLAALPTATATAEILIKLVLVSRLL